MFPPASEVLGGQVSSGMGSDVLFVEFVDVGDEAGVVEVGREDVGINVNGLNPPLELVGVGLPVVLLVGPAVPLVGSVVLPPPPGGQVLFPPPALVVLPPAEVVLLPPPPPVGDVVVG